MTPVTPEDILATHIPPVVDLAQRLREVISQAEPEAREAAYPGWHAIGYRHREAGYFAGYSLMLTTSSFTLNTAGFSRIRNAACRVMAAKPVTWSLSLAPILSLTTLPNW